jgi:hypothetical protein
MADQRNHMMRQAGCLRRVMALSVCEGNLLFRRRPLQYALVRPAVFGKRGKLTKPGQREGWMLGHDEMRWMVMM